MIKPAFGEKMIGLDDLGDEVTPAGLADAVAIIARSTLREDALHRPFRSARPAVYLRTRRRRIVPWLLARNAPAVHGYWRPTCTIERADVGSDLIRLAVAQRPLYPAHILKPEAMT